LEQYRKGGKIELLPYYHISLNTFIKTIKNTSFLNFC